MAGQTVRADDEAAGSDGEIYEAPSAEELANGSPEEIEAFYEQLPDADEAEPGAAPETGEADGTKPGDAAGDEGLQEETFDPALNGDGEQGGSGEAGEGGESGEGGEEPQTPAQVALYFIPHQDDDLLTFAGSIFDDMQKGYEVHAVLCTDGRASHVYSTLHEKYGLSPKEFIAARDVEFKASLTALGVKPENIHIPANRIQDGRTSGKMAELRALIAGYIDQYPGAYIRANMPVASEVDQHDDHANIGIIASDLMREGRAERLRVLIDPYVYTTHIKDGLPPVEIYPTDLSAEESKRLDNAIAAYKFKKVSEKRYGIGYTSASKLFDALAKSRRSYGYEYKPENVVRYGGNKRYETARNAVAGKASEGRSGSNFKAPDSERMEGALGANGLQDVPDSDHILVYDDAVVAPHNGNGVTYTSKGTAVSCGGTLIVASGKDFPDALAASSFGCEIMLTKPDALSPETRSEILRTLPARIIVMGAASAVSDAVVKAIQQIDGTVTQTEIDRLAGTTGIGCRLCYEPEVIRCGGKNRYETSYQVIRAFGCASTTRTAIVTTGMNYADAVSIAPYSAATHSPILLTKNGDLLTGGYNVLKSVKSGINEILIIGGTNVVSKACEKKLNKMGYSVTRLEGKNRYETSVAVADFCISGSDAPLSVGCVSLATGTNFPDALIAGPITANNGSVLILTHSKAAKWKSGLAFLAEHKIEIAEAGFNLRIFGSEGAVSRAAKELALCAVGPRE